MKRAGLLLFLAACSVPQDEGVREIQALVQRRTGHAVHWFRDPEHNQRVADAIAGMLDRGLTLGSAEKIALLNDRQLQATFERLGMAQADLFQAGLIANPRIGVAVRLPTEGELATNVEGDFGLDLVGLFTLAARERVAQAELDMVVLEVASAVLDAVFDARRAYYTFQAAQQLFEINHTIASAAQGAYESAAALHQAGNISDLQLAQEQAMFEQARLDYLDSEGEVAAAREDLNRRLGLWGRQATGWWVEAPLAGIPGDEVALRDLATLAIARRLDLAAMRKRTEHLIAALQLAGDWGWLTHLEIGASLERELDGTVSVGPSAGLELPIFDQGQGQVARLRAALLQSYHEVTAKAVAIRADVRALRGELVRHRRKSIHYRDVVIPLRERIVSLTLEQYNFMLVGTFDLLEKKRQEAEAYRHYLAEVRDYWITRAELARAVGGRLPRDRPKPLAAPR